MTKPCLLGFLCCLIVAGGACRIDADALEKSFDSPGMNVEWDRDGYQLKVKSRGQFTLNREESDLETLSFDGLFEIEEFDGSTRRKVTMSPESENELRRQFWVDGRPEDFEPNGRIWLSELLPEVIRETAYQVEERVRRISQEGGPSAVIEEIRQVDEGHSIRLHIEALAELGGLSPEEVAVLIEQAGRISSGNDRLRSVASLAELHPEDIELSRKLIETGGGESSSVSRWILSRVIEVRKLDNESALEVAGALSNVRSSHQKSSLIASLARSTSDPAVLSALVDSASSIRSSFEKRRCLEAILDRDHVPAEVLKRTADVSAGISSSFQKSETLAVLATKSPMEGEVLDALLDASETVRSSFEREKVLNRLLDAQNLNAASLEKVRQRIEEGFPEGESRGRLLDKISGQ